MEDTIAAIATAVGSGGIAIIRISGACALGIADAVFSSSHGKASVFPTHTVHYGKIIGNNEIVDQVMLTVLRAPHSYTTEDTVEINCHGGMVTAKLILDLCLQHGARLAQPGEFTKRAFLNGRIDLTQAEAVMDLIQARTKKAQAVAVRSLEGGVSRQVEAIRERLLGLLAHIEAYVDFPEEDIQTETRASILGNLAEAQTAISKLLATSRQGRVLRSGALVAIVGRPNVGKSSLMNAILGCDRSIVTPIPGTTRDTIEESVSINGIPIRLTDTAGFRKARGSAEQSGINRSHNILRMCDLILHVLDTSKSYSRYDKKLAGSYAGRRVLFVLNKIDKKSRLNVPNDFVMNNFVSVSATRGDGLSELKKKISDIILDGGLGSSDLDIAINSRHELSLEFAAESLANTVACLSINTGYELVGQELRIALQSLEDVIGVTTAEDILDRIFSSFCIGK
jgi:tRNA modification GTPase